MAEVGAFTLENLTTGMYVESLVIFREYIQNACDAIDKAVDAGILQEGDGKIEIAIDAAKRRITIADNATGISVLDFKSSLINIAYSDKTLETDRGFRGIGRLCGLAYCRELRFISTARGEGIQSTVIFDAAKLRAIFYSDKKYTVKEALDEIVSFETTVADADEHFFRVELLDITDTNKDLLDVEKVRDYLSFVAPVIYSPQLYYEELIKQHADALNFTITEYKIEVNGEPLEKPYKINVRTRRLGDDEIFGLDFRDFRDEAGKLLAWSWIGLSTFKGILSEQRETADYKMRCIRLRAGNIQIGDEYALQDLFTESRGTKYFIGEIHTVDTNLRPNGRRDYLEENATYKILETALEKYFAELSEVYRTASDIRGFIKTINAPAEAELDFQRGQSVCKNRAELRNELVKLNKIADSARKKIDSLREKAKQDPETPLSRVVLRMTENIPDNSNPSPTAEPDNKKGKQLGTSSKSQEFPPVHWNKNYRKLYNAIKLIILKNPTLKGKELLNKINEVLREEFDK